MRKARKRVLSTLLAAVLALGLMPSVAFADGGGNGMECEGGNDCTHVAAIGNVHYGTLADAVNAVQDSKETTITLLKSSSGNGVVVPSGRNIIFDLNNYTYDIDSDTVGSSGTETNGFQLLRDSTITFEKGTITSTKAKILIQNYSNLTLDNVVLDGTSLVSSAPYTLSNNYGNTVIRDSEITARPEGVAFDLYFWPKNGYEDGVSVTVEGDSVIDGTIEYGGDDTTKSKDVAEYASLSIKGGTFSGELKLGEIGTSSKAGINITGGTFQAADGSAWNVSDYVQPGMTQDASGNIVISDNAVAKIGSVGYKTLQAAVAAGEDGDTIELLRNHTPLSNVQTIEGKDLTLDLGGNTLTQQLDVKDCHLTLKNGIVESPLDGAYLSGGAAVYVYGSDESNAVADSCVLNVESTAKLRGYYGILISGPTYSSNDAYGAIVNVEGTVEGPIFISGNMGNTTALNPNGNAVTVNIFSGAKLDGNHWKGGAEGTHAIAMNGAAIVNVEDDATLIGTDAIAVKRGQLNITGGTFTATGEKVDPAEANNNGSETTGSAISVTSTYNKDITGLSSIDINISGGTFTSQNNAAVYLGHSESSGTLVGYRGKLDINITGGAFNSSEDVSTVYVAKKIDADKGLTVTGEDVAEKFISGGTFSGNVSTYVVDGAQQNTDGSIGPADGSVAAIGNKGYTTLAGAFTAAQQISGGATVTLLQDGVVLDQAIPASVTLQVPSSATLIVNDPTNLTTGTLEVQAGGKMMLASEEFIGGTEARLNLTRGSITLAVGNSAAVVTLKNGSEANIPADKELVLTFQAAQGTSYPMNAVIEASAKLTVNKKLTVANGSALTVNGTLNVASGGILRVNSAATLGGDGTVSNSGIITLHSGAGSETTTVEIPITLASGGVVYSQFDASNIDIKNSVKSELSPEQPVDDVANSGESGNPPLFGYKYSYYAPAPAPTPTPEQFDVAVADVQNGAVELSAKTAKEGQKVTVTVTPDLGWELAQLTVADEDGDALELTENADGTYSFTMPAGDVTVHASFADAWENPFTDLSEDHWGYGAVRTANLLGLMKGIGGTTLFAPDDGLLREQAATVMWNLMGAGDVSRPEAPQADVDQSQWYAPYVNWAVDSKVMDGYSEDDFGVGDSLTREQFAAVVAKAVGADVDSADQAALGAFPDADGVSGWARATMAWAVEAGVLNGVGTEDGSRELQATRELTRAEMATMMVNAIEVGVLDFGA